jgi:quercetin dioxygenase-like cupin family protein
MGQRYLVAGKRVSMRLWDLEPGSEVKHSTNRDYETVGYVISGSAKLELEGQTLLLKEGDSWLVPAGAAHKYTVTEHFKAIEATAPPSRGSRSRRTLIPRWPMRYQGLQSHQWRSS